MSHDPLGENHAQGDVALALLAGLAGFGVVVWIVAGRPFWTAAHINPGHGFATPSSRVGRLEDSLRLHLVVRSVGVR